MFSIAATTRTNTIFAEGFHAIDDSVFDKSTSIARTKQQSAPTTTTAKTTKRLLSSNTDNPTTTSIEKNTMDSKVGTAKALFERFFGDDKEPEPETLEDVLPVTSAIAVAPGRVNLIGEHTDYTGGFVLPFAIGFSTVVYGRGSIRLIGGSERRARLRFASSLFPEDDSFETFEITESSTPPETVAWTSYVLGTIFQYIKDLPVGAELSLDFCITSDVPLGSGLSSSASLEVAVGRFVEAVLGEHAFGSEYFNDGFDPAKARALRCQKAENEWCDSPCGIMDQAISSSASGGSLMLIDCRTLNFTVTRMATESLFPDDSMPVLVVANSNIQHSIGGGEYPIRVAQCKSATKALQKVNPEILTLRDATIEDLENAKKCGMSEVDYKRARHVVTENERTIQAREELENGDWERVGVLMNESHTSMRDDYEVSCEEVDVLVDIAQNSPGVYGSRLTGGGFGGCTVTLVDEDRAEELIERLKTEYKARTGIECPCFVTRPARGAHLLSVKDHQPMVPEPEYY